MKQFLQRLVLVAAFALPFAFTTQIHAQVSCAISFEMTDDFGDGWNGNQINVFQGDSLLGSVTLSDGLTGQASVVCNNTDTIRLVFSEGSYPDEASVTVRDGAGTVILNNVCLENYNDGATLATFVNVCPSCIAPTDFRAIYNSADTAIFAWSDPIGTSWEVVYGVAGMNPDSVDAADINSVYDTTFTAAGLTSGVQYHFYVRTDCGSGDYSAWVGPVAVYPGVYMLENGNDTLVGCNFLLTDNGGPNGDYLSNSNGTVVIYPTAADSAIAISGSCSTETCCDHLYIYDGAGTTGTLLFASGASQDETIPTYTSLSGPITVSFTSDGSVNKGGFVLNTHCVYKPSCSMVSSFTVDSCHSDSVYLSWVDTANQSNFQLVYGQHGFVVDSVDPTEYIDLSSTSTMLTGLTSGNQYDFYLRANCGNEASYWYGPVTATIGTPYLMNAASDTLRGCGYIIYDAGGPTGSYQASSNNYLYLYPNDATQTIQISGSGYTESCCDSLVIYDGIGTSTRLGGYKGTFTIPPTLSESGALTIYFHSDGSVQYDGYELITSCVPLPDCSRPTSLTLDAVSDVSATLSWVEVGTASDWVIEYGPTGFTQGTGTLMTTTSTTDSIVNLTPNTAYDAYVSSLCASGDTSLARMISFRTACTPIDTLPYFYGFEGTTASTNGTIDPCWKKGTTYPYSSYPYPSSTAATGSRSLYFYGYYGQYRSWAVMPMVRASLDSLQVTFKMRKAQSYSYYGSRLRVGVMTNPDDLTTFTEVGVFDATSTTAFDLFTCYFAGYTGTGKYIAFICDDIDASRYYNYVYLDDVTIDYAPECGPVTDVNVVNTQYNAYVTWTPGSVGNYSGAIVGLQDTATNTWIYDTVAGNNITFSGLTPSQGYNVTVMSMCDGAPSGQTVSESFLTLTPLCGAMVPGTADTAILGTGTSQTSGVPVNSSWGNTVCQSIFTAAELHAMGIDSGSINAIDYTWTTSSNYNKEFSIFIGSTGDSLYASVDNMIPLTTHTLVYNGAHPTGTTGTVHYNLDATYNWDGNTNLVITTFMNQPAGQSQSSAGFYGLSTNTSVNRTTYRYQDSNPFTTGTATTSGYGYTSTYRPSITIYAGICAALQTCVATAPIVEAATPTSVTLAWAPGHDETSWSMFYKKATENNYRYAGVATTNNFTYTGLQSGSLYDFRIFSQCTADSVMSEISAATECAKIDHLPFFEDFNSWGTGSGVIPNCWSRYGSYSTYTYISPSFNHTGNGGSIYVYRSSTASTADCFLTLPELDTNIYHANQLQVVFSTYSSYSSYVPCFQIGVLTDPQQPTSFVAVDTVTHTVGEGVWQTHEVSLANYTDTGAYVCIRTCNMGSYFYGYIDDVTLELIPTCPRPDSLTATNATTTTVDLSWHERGSASNWIVEYGPEGFVPGTGVGTTVAANSNPFTLTNVPVAFIGEYYVRSVCSSTDTGEYSRIPCRFATTQIPATLPYSYDFEDAAEWANWQCNTNNRQVNWYRGTAEAGAGNYGLYISADSGATNSTLAGICNVAAYRDVDFGTVDSSFTLSFKYKVGGSTAGRYDALMVFLVDPSVPVVASTAGITSPWGNVNNLYRVALCYLDTTWGTYTASFDTISGVQRVAFFWFNQNMDSFIGGPAAIDDLTINYSACPRPLSLEVDVATISENTADISWEGPANATYEVIYREIGGTTNNYVTVNNTTSYTLTGLQSSTNYAVWVRKICGADTSLTCDGVAFTTTNHLYQMPLVNDFEGNGTYIPLLSNGSNVNGWVIGAAENADSVAGHALYISEDGINATYSANSASVSYAVTDVHIDSGLVYYSYDWKCQGESSFDFIRVALVPVSEDLTPGTSLPTGLSSTSMPASWISLDHNTKLNLESTWQHVEDSINIINSGNYHFVFVWRNDGSVGNNPSAVIDNIMLYRTLNICYAPQVTVGNVTFDGATLSWSGDASSYEVGVVEQSNQNWPASIVVNNANTYDVTGLTPNTTYAFRVRALCDSIGTSAWTEGTFTTEDLPCFVVTNTRVSNITVSSASVAWDNDPQSTASAWVVNVFNSTTNIMDTVHSNPATISGLYDNTEYFVSVRSMCAATVYSDWSDTVSFTTSTCQPVSNVVVSNITNNGATLTWTAGANETSWEVSYGDMDFTEGNGTNVTVTSTTYTITGLQAGFDYDVYVRAICGTGITSDWSSKKQFTTTAGQGIDGVDGNYSLSIYPNPTSGNTTISLRGVEGEVEISVVDMNGRVISTETINCGADCTKSMNVANLAQGTYFVRVLGDGISSVRKLIVR